MAIIRGVRPDQGFYILSNRITDDHRLSLDGLGLLVYLLSRPDNWEVQEAQLRKQFRIGRDKCRKLLAELVNLGYAKKTQVRSQSGSFDKNDWVISEEPAPLTENPSTAEPFTENPSTDKPSTENQSLNKDLDIPNTELNNTLGSSDDKPTAPKEKNDSFSEAFENLWRLYPRREGSNPKNKALSAYRASLKRGHDHQTILDGLKRYITYCQAKQQLNTPYVMQASRFFGPGDEFLNRWDVSSSQVVHGQFKSAQEKRAEAAQSIYDPVKATVF